MAAFTREECIKLLLAQQAVLQKAGETRYPQRGDFSPEEVCAIKAQLGPWPRALECAGIKAVSPRHETAQARKLEKRIAAKRKQTAAKKAPKASEPSPAALRAHTGEPTLVHRKMEE